MANDYYIDDDEGNWAFLEEEFREWQLFSDVADLIMSKGYNYVLSTIMEIVVDKENKQ